jgi:hypothetical protein
MDPLHLAIATIPLALYLVMIGGLNLIRRPTMMSGVWEVLLLAFAVSGWILVGPIELFLPDTTVADYGIWVWIPLLGLYVLIVLLIALLMRPRIVIYNVSVEQLRPLLSQTVSELEERARWAGDCLTMPQQRVQLYIETYGGIRQVHLVAAGGQQDLDAWRRLGRALAPRLRELPVPIHARGASLLAIGLALLIAVGVTSVTRHQEIAAALRDLSLR